MSPEDNTSSARIDDTVHAARREVRDLARHVRDQEHAVNCLWRVARHLTTALLLLGLVAPFVGVRAPESTIESDGARREDVSILSLLVVGVPGDEGPIGSSPTRTSGGVVVLGLLALVLVLMILAVQRAGRVGRLLATRGAATSPLIAASIVLGCLALITAPVHVPEPRDQWTTAPPAGVPHSYAVDLLVLGLVAAITILLLQPDEDDD